MVKKIKRWASDRLQKAKEWRDFLSVRGVLRTVSDMAEYRKIRRLIPAAAGYHPGSVIRQLCLRSEEKGFSCLKDYYPYLMDHEEERLFWNDHLTYLGSHFFRGDMWPALSVACHEAFDGTRPVRVWCAACSTGKEVYSVLMMLREFLPAECIRLLATDYNDEVLAQCAEGWYGSSNLAEIPERFHGFIRPGGRPRETGGTSRGGFCFREDLLSAVSTKHLNLLTDAYPEGFDLILCRNAIKFFRRREREKVQKRLTQSLSRGGLLMLSDEDSERIRRPAALGLTRLGDINLYRKA